MRVPDILTDLATKIIQRRQLNPYTSHQNFSIFSLQPISPEDVRIKKHQKHDRLIDNHFRLRLRYAVWWY